MSSLQGFALDNAALAVSQSSCNFVRCLAKLANTTTTKTLHRLLSLLTPAMIEEEFGVKMPDYQQWLHAWHKHASIFVGAAPSSALRTDGPANLEAFMSIKGTTPFAPVLSVLEPWSNIFGGVPRSQVKHGTGNHATKDLAAIVSCMQEMHAQGLFKDVLPCEEGQEEGTPSA